MPKEMVSIPQGNLLRVAATKGITTQSALNEKTGVDRKTLRSIEAGQPVKQTTLQSIADKLRVPISHLLVSNVVDKDAADKDQDIRRFDDPQYQEIKLQKLDGPSLRQLASETHERSWFLNVELSAELKTALLKLRKALDEWFEGMAIGFDLEWAHAGADNLLEEIEHIETSADIDKSVEELAQYKLKIFGGTYVAWEVGWGKALEYHSHLTAALKITTEDNSTVRVCIGRVPPQNFSASQIAHLESKTRRFDRIEIDGAVVWSRQPKEGDL
jgi:DNA-binding XRE family transcriptional regulator